ncbi:MAG: hypothetical protein FJ279_07550 [Planctomycetes bacterium]|nr:hypothetical protein [Planctomycetota bacterium]
MAGNFLTLEEVLQELQIDKAELDAMVAQGKLRQLRDGKLTKFRREDVVKLKKLAETDATVVFDGSSKPKDEETADDRLFEVLKEDGKRSADATIITPEAAKEKSDSDIAPSPPAKKEEKEKSDSDIDSAIFDDEETSKVDVKLADKGDSAEDDSDQTSIIPVGTAPGPKAKASDDEESVFTFDDDEADKKPGDESSSSDIMPAKPADAASSAGEPTIALEPDSSSDILEAESDSSDDGADSSEESSSDILDLAVEDSATESAVDLDAGAKDSDVVTDLIQLSKEDKSSDTAEVELEDSGSADVKEADASDDVLTIEDADKDSRPTPPTDAKQEAVETADTIDLTLSDTSTAQVEEVEEGKEGEKDGPALLTMSDEKAEAEEAEAPPAEEAAAPEEAAEEEEAEAAPEPGAVVVAPAIAYPPAPVFTALLGVASLITIFSGMVLYNTVRGMDLPITKWATDLALNLLSK